MTCAIVLSLGVTKVFYPDFFSTSSIQAVATKLSAVL